MSIDGIFEHGYHLDGSDDMDEELNELHILDDQTRIAMLRTGYDDGTPFTKYILSDHLGSSNVILETSGAVYNREEYYPFGETSFGSFGKKRYRYVGKEKDEESGLYYYGARYYAPWSCRFISVDLLALKYVFQSPYVYADDNPVCKMDYNGMGSGEPPAKNGDKRTVDGCTETLHVNSGDKNDVGVWLDDRTASDLRTIDVLSGIDKQLQWYHELKSLLGELNQLQKQWKADSDKRKQNAKTPSTSEKKTNSTPYLDTGVPLIFEDEITENKAEFVAKLKEISSKLSINPNWLMAVMHSESGLNPRAVNPDGNATGLIQFMPSTASALGTTVDELYAMSNVEQLDYVYKYFKSYKGKMTSYVDLYLVTFFPVALNKGDDFVLQSKGISAERIAESNKVFDTNKDKQITVGEVRQAMLKRIPTKFHSYLN